MTDSDAGTAPVAGEAQTPPPATGTPPTPDEVTTLRSRNAGLDAKVTSLSQQAAAEKAAREAAEQKLRDYEAELVSKDEALRAQLAAKEAEAALARKEAALARVEARFPETYAVLGESAASLSEDQLAAAEARFRGVGDDKSAPPPLGANPARGGTEPVKSIEDMTVEELRKHLATYPTEVMFRQ
jgi:preprotein translocase subunit SecD